MIIFDAREIISYKNFHDFLCENKNCFNQKKHALFTHYGILQPITWNDSKQTYQAFRHEYNALIHDIINTVLHFYRKYLPEHCLIVEFGSFAKGTERIFSDIDLTICYDTPKTPLFECAEELIDYTITAILGYSIDHIHGKFQHFPEMGNLESYGNNDSKYRIIFYDGMIEYKPGPETFYENLMHIKNVRDYKSVITGYEEKYIKKCNIDCLYSINIIENTTHHNFFSDLTNLEQKYNICQNYAFNLNPSELQNPFKISKLKHILKNDGIVECYIFFSSLRKHINLSDSYSMTLDSIKQSKAFLDLFGEQYALTLFETIYKFLFFWNRVELSLKKRNIPLSTRCHKEFTHKEINALLAEDWKQTTDISSVISAKNELISLIKKAIKDK